MPRRVFLSMLFVCAVPAFAPAAEPLFPDDPYFAESWHLPKLGLPEAWGYSQGSPSVIVAVVDTGVDPLVADLAGRVLPALSSTGSTAVQHPHGTWVASSLAMGIDNGIGGAGVGNFTILPVVATWNTITTPEAIADGIRLAADHGAKVINVSLKPHLGYGPLNQAAEYALSKGALTFVAAGNDNLRSTLSGLDNLIFVAGTDEQDERWTSGAFVGSTWGPFVDLSAPASNVLISYPGGVYDRISGTSFASPLAAGAAALAWSINPELTALEVRQLLIETAVDLGAPGWDEQFGHGRIDIAAVARAAYATVPEPGVGGVVLAAVWVAWRRRR